MPGTRRNKGANTASGEDKESRDGGGDKKPQKKNEEKNGKKGEADSGQDDGNETPPELHPADGGCMAVAGFATGVWKSEAEGVKLLDKATAEWKKSDKLRNDFKTESFLGVPGETWTREVMKRVVIDAECDFRKGKFVQANEHGEPTKIQYTNKPMAKVDVTADSLIFISGVVNPSYLRPDGTRETLFESSAKDNPKKDRASWQHMVGVRALKFYEGGVWHNIRGLHLTKDGSPNSENGAFYDIEEVYHIIPKEGSLPDAKKKQAEARAAAKIERRERAASSAEASMVETKRQRTEIEHKVGTRVVVEFMHDNEPMEFPGEIAAARNNNRYMVKFDDGDLRSVPASKVMLEEE